jgi:hypothetical protein
MAVHDKQTHDSADKKELNRIPKPLKLGQS